MKKTAKIYQKFESHYHKAIQIYFFLGLICELSIKFNVLEEYIDTGLDLFLGKALHPVFSFLLSDIEDMKHFIDFQDWGSIVKKNTEVYEKILIILNSKKSWKFNNFIEKIGIKNNIEERLIHAKLLILLRFNVIGTLGRDKKITLLNLDKFEDLKVHVLNQLFSKS